MLTKLVLACAIIPALVCPSTAPSPVGTDHLSFNKGRSMMIEHIPVFMVTPSSAASSTDYDITVVLNDVTPTNLTVSISTSRSASFSILPSQVMVPAGHDSVTFTVRTSSNYQTCNLSATANGVTATSGSVASEFSNKSGK